jgi:hypothetical protein
MNHWDGKKPHFSAVVVAVKEVFANQIMNNGLRHLSSSHRPPTMKTMTWKYQIKLVSYR